MRIVVCWEIDCEAGNEASVTSTRKVPSASLASWASPPPQPLRTASAAINEAVDRRAVTVRANLPPGGAGAPHFDFRFDGGERRGIRFTPA